MWSEASTGLSVRLEIYFNFVLARLGWRVFGQHFSPHSNLTIKFLSRKFMFVVDCDGISFRKRKYYIRGFNVSYNFFTTLYLQGLEGGWRKHYNFRCQPVDYSTNPSAMRVIYLLIWYFFVAICFPFGFLYLVVLSFPLMELQSIRKTNSYKLDFGWDLKLLDLQTRSYLSRIFIDLWNDDWLTWTCLFISIFNWHFFQFFRLQELCGFTTWPRL